MPFWIQKLLGDYGHPILFLAVFLNNAGLPVPGDTFLLAAGVLAQTGVLSLPAIIGTAAGACFLGGTAGYWMGRRWGRRILERLGYARLDPRMRKQAKKFLGRHGGKAVFFARFVALVHPVTGLLAGSVRMPFGSFLFFNLAGSLAYALLYAALGYFFGESWDILKIWLGRAAALGLVGIIVLGVLAALLRSRFQSILSFFSRRS